MSLVGVRLRRSHAVLAGGIALALFLGFVIAYFFDDTGPLGLSKLLLLPFGILLLVPFGVAMLRRKPVNFLEPIYVVIFGYALFLFVRPAYILAFDDFALINTMGGEREVLPFAISLAMAGLAGLYLGYYSFIGPAVANALPVTKAQLSSKRLRNLGWVLIVVGSLLYSVFLGQQTGSTLAYEGRTAYFYLGIDVVGVGILLLFYWVRLDPRWRRILLFAALFILFFVAATYLASRYRVLYLAFALLASYFLLENKPFRCRNLLPLLPLALIYVAVVGALRGGERRITFDDLSQLDLQFVFERFFSSSGDLNIFDTYVRVLTAIPDLFPYQVPGRTFAYLFVAFIPRTLWPGKPLTTERLINTYAIGDYGELKAQGGGFAYSLPGSFYIEGGIVAVLVGTILFGIFCRVIWAYHIKHNNVSSKLLLAITLPVILLYQREGFTDNNTVWYLTYLVPVIVGLRYAAMRTRLSKRRTTWLGGRTAKE